MLNKANVCLLIYFSIAMLLAPIGILELDSFYYWDWSRHLALSYYDGAPMIAYFIKLSTLLLGDTLFAISFVGIAVTALTGFIIYKTGRFFLNKKASYVAMLLWIFSPLVTQDLLYQTTYDTPLTLFWALTVYFLVKYLKNNDSNELYFSGASIGFMMLSKYSGIVLILAILIFLIFTKYRSLFKNHHLYMACLLAIAIFSPVILWNYQHEWQSFIYQLNAHQAGSVNHTFGAMTKLIFRIFIPSLNILLIPPLLCCFKSSQKKTPEVYLCLVICVTVIGFYLITGSNANIRKYWLAQYLISGALLGGFCFQTFTDEYRKLTFFLIGLSGFISLVILLGNSYPLSSKEPRQSVYYRFMQDINAEFPQLPKTIVTVSWYEARMGFFLKNKPQIYTLNCGFPQNQYGLWSAKISHEIANKTIKEAMYFDKMDRSSCMEKYFDKCERIWTKTYRRHHIEYPLYVYKCTNNPTIV